MWFIKKFKYSLTSNNSDESSCCENNTKVIFSEWNFYSNPSDIICGNNKSINFICENIRIVESRYMGHDGFNFNSNGYLMTNSENDNYPKGSFCVGEFDLNDTTSSIAVVCDDYNSLDYILWKQELTRHILLFIGAVFMGFAAAIYILMPGSKISHVIPNSIIFNFLNISYLLITEIKYYSLSVEWDVN